MALSPLDPLARSGGVLPSADPSALEVAMARNKQEDELAKGIQALNQKAAADAAKVKSKEKMAAQKQLTELTKGTTFMPHTEASAKFYNDFIAREGKRWQDFDTGTGGDPMQPGTQAWIDRNRDLQAWEQMQASSKQIQDKYGKVAEHVMANKGDYALDTLERIQEDYANPQHLIDQTFPDDPVAYIDLNKAIESRFGAIKPEITAWATQDGTASGTFEQVLLPDMQAVAEQMAVENPDLAAKLGETYESYTPEKKAQIQGMMKAYKITEPAAVAMDLAIAKYGAGKETQISEQVSSSGYGAAKDRAAAVWFAEYLKGTQEGTYETTPEMKEEIQGFFLTADQPKGAPGWWSRKQVPTGLQMDKTLNGFVWDEKEFYDARAKKNIKVQRDIKDVVIDPNTEKYLVKVGPAGEAWSKEKGEVVVVPFDQAESKLGPAVLGLNTDRIGGITKYDVAAEQEGYGTRKGTGATNIAKTQPRSGPYVPGRQQSGPYIPGR